ncbi:MAG TPA: ArsI/CadI family heavy metal resistance metalloenzyme [Pyrinomonadaceae bacterium]|jgi:catechol 2,3-dioxygenase-like lactoylglutathione lyase family enzyme
MEKEANREVQVLKAHLALNVKDVEKSLEFYRKMLGLEPSKVRTGYAKFDVANPPLNLTLNQVAFGERGALSHMGLQVGSTDDVLLMRRRWAEAGLLTRDEMQTNCCYALQDKTWVQDPDGNEWEAFVVLEDNLAQTSSCCTTAVAETVLTESSDETATALSTEANSCCGTQPAPLSISR